MSYHHVIAGRHIHTFGPNILGPEFIFLVFQNELGISTWFSFLSKKKKKKKNPKCIIFRSSHSNIYPLHLHQAIKIEITS